MLKPTTLIRAFISIALIALIALTASSPILAQSSPDPKPAFEATLPRVNALAQLGERYHFQDIQVAGNWAVAIAEPVLGSAFGGMPVHSAMPMIGLYDPNANGWQVVIPTLANAAEFNALLTNLPKSLMDEATQAYFEQPLAQNRIGGLRAINYTGHKLPWKKSLIGYAFSKDASGHVNQVDFDIQGLASTADVLASKPGTVVFVKESSDAGQCGNFSNVWKQANMVVLQHAPAEFSWYVHLAFNSVPVAVGDVVAAGTKVGVEGETGYACGVHVHYMVSGGHTAWTNPSDPNAAPWASTNSLAPTDFNEVIWANIQNGQTYVSQNDGQTDCSAPALQTPVDGAVVTTTAISFSWSGVADCSFTGYQVRLKTVINPDSGGTTLYDVSEQTLSRTLTISPTWHYQDVFWNVRANGTNAPWATRRLRVEPTITGTYTLFTQTNFAGDVLIGSATISNLTNVNFNDRARSLKLDVGMSVVLCSDANFRGDCGRATGPTQLATLDTLAAGLSGTVSSVRTCASTCPPAPITPTIQYPISTSVVLSSTPIVLKWQVQGMGDVFYAEVSGGTLTETVVLDWSSATQRTTPGFAPSSTPYSLRLRAANSFGTSAWSKQNFIVVAAQSVFIPVAHR